ncbi:PEP-CTERM sorting domain-containing protein [Oryzomonas rubra]|nr:PEP-CTERM sorting domain-containing protein [Oryzomonas rubra]
MRKQNYLQIAILTSVAVWVLFCGKGYATIVYPDSPDWQKDLQASGTASIETDKPRDGNASLKLTTSGNLNDWAFWNYYAGTNLSLGTLSNLKDFSFDWYRTGVTNIATSDVPWQAQTPVMRIYINDHGVLSELVWEKYYTNSSLTITDTWINQNLMNQNLWQHTFGSDGRGTYTLVGGVSSTLNPDDPLLALNISQWLSNSFYSSEAFVYGFGVGVGSYWPKDYTGYVDDIHLTFSDSEENYNFEIPVPEPSPLLLMVLGVAFLMMGHFIWFRRQNCTH